MADTTRPATSHGRRALHVASMLCCLLLFVLVGCNSGSPESSGPPPIPTDTLSPGRATPLPVTSADWTMYHANLARTGDVPNMPDPHALTKRWSQALSGAVYAEPLVVDGRLIVATEHDIVYSFDASTGKELWSARVGTPVPLQSLPCGDIDPLGITGTPVYDPHTGLVLAVAETYNPSGDIIHQLVGLDASTGHIKVSRTIDPPGADARAHQQRGALALLGDAVYVPFGGLDGDCSDYHGLVVGSKTDGTGPLFVFQVPTAREGGIWSTPGPVMDAAGNLYVSVGNGAATGGTWDHTDSVLRLSPQLQLEDSFAPDSWARDNASDLDLGSMGPVLLPGGLIYANGKSSKGYLLQASNLGGVGGQLQTLSTCSAYGSAAVNSQSLFIPCTDGILELVLSGSGVGAELVAGWKAHSQVTGSPVVGGNTVYGLAPGSGDLYALDATTGAVRAMIHVGTANRFATPALYQATIFVGTMNGIAAVDIS
jgi:outer membrane protein assembly factor BamB